MGFFSRLFGGDKRNAKLAAWGQAVHLTALQRESMWELYLSMKTGVVPSVDPLQKLNNEDKEYILRICGSDFRPAGNTATLIH